jgi:catechol 2,3-dioxygenase-like lactoylglutathione lyase family enzyme
MTYVQGSHHVTLSVANAQEDVDFHVKILGMRFIKRTVLFEDGGWTCDESPHELGTRFRLPEQFEHRRDEILGRLEPIDV